MAKAIDTPVPRRSMKQLIGDEKQKASGKKTTKKNSKKDEDNDVDFHDDNHGAAAPPAEKSAAEKKPKEKELSVEVLKAKITNDIFLYSEYKVNLKDDKGSFKKDGENPVHEDLKKAFSGLAPHLASMSEQYNGDGKLDDNKIVCRGFSIGSNGEGVTLFGTRLLSNGKAFNFNTPFYKWDTDQSESLFKDDAVDLRSAVNKCRAEVILYLFKHKYQPEVNKNND